MITKITTVLCVLWVVKGSLSWEFERIVIGTKMSVLLITVIPCSSLSAADVVW